jgi:hypothetical protein
MATRCIHPGEPQRVGAIDLESFQSLFKSRLDVESPVTTCDLDRALPLGQCLSTDSRLVRRRSLIE